MVLYQEETKKALHNFPFHYHGVDLLLVYAIVNIKQAAAVANAQEGGITQDKQEAIVWACREILKGGYDDQFVTCALQGGAGTSLHTNVNEVIATLSEHYLQKKGKHIHVSPLDDVNKSQSTNDVNPSALRIVCLDMIPNIANSLDALIEALRIKAQEGRDVVKMGRTHLQDAVPITIGEEFNAYADILVRQNTLVRGLSPLLSELNLGGTAVGNGINATKVYTEAVYAELMSLTGYSLKPQKNLMSGTSSQTDFLHTAQILNSLFTDLSKIASDLRLMASGPRGGFSEIILPTLQNGSTIMPAKVNPIILEVVNQTAFLFSGYTLTIQQASQAAQFELGVMFPILADTLIQMLRLAEDVVSSFAHLVPNIKINSEACQNIVERSFVYATYFTPVLGHERVSSIVRKALHEQKSLKEVLLEEEPDNAEVQSILARVFSKDR
jgi:aspartate ammonia-lyase